MMTALPRDVMAKYVAYVMFVVATGNTASRMSRTHRLVSES